MVADVAADVVNNDRSCGAAQDGVMDYIFSTTDEEGTEELDPIYSARTGQNNEINRMNVRSFFSTGDPAAGETQWDRDKDTEKGPDVAEGGAMELHREEKKELDILYESMGSVQASRSKMEAVPA